MLKFLIEKEFKQIRRNSFIPRIIVAMPLMMILIFPWAASQEVKDLKLSVVDNDHSTYSDRLVRKATASGYFQLADVSTTNNDAMNSVEAGNADIILEIRDEFERDIVNDGVAKVMISTNSVNGTKGGLGSSYMSAIINDYAVELREENATQAGVVSAEIPMFGVMSQYQFNPHLDYKIFMVPALIVMLLTMLCGFLPALNIVAEKEVGTIEQMNVTPVGKVTFILAKLIPYWIIGFVILAICIGLAALAYGIYPVGSLITIFIFASIYILVVSGFGLVISNYSDTMQQAMFVMYFFIMIFILMSGLFTPVSCMPSWAQQITFFNPLKYFIQVMRMVYLKGSAFGDMTSQFFILCGFAIVLNTWAILSYKKSSR